MFAKTKSHNVAFHKSLHCLQSQNRFSEKEIQYFLEIMVGLLFC